MESAGLVFRAHRVVDSRTRKRVLSLARADKRRNALPRPARATQKGFVGLCPPSIKSRTSHSLHHPGCPACRCVGRWRSCHEWNVSQSSPVSPAQFVVGDQICRQTHLSPAQKSRSSYRLPLITNSESEDRIGTGKVRPPSIDRNESPAL